MKKKKTSHFSVEDVIRNAFRKPVSRGTLGKDAQGMLWAYGLSLKNSLFCVEVIKIDLETQKEERINEKERSYEQRGDANAYISALIKEILPVNPLIAKASVL